MHFDKKLLSSSGWFLKKEAFLNLHFWDFLKTVAIGKNISFKKSPLFNHTEKIGELKIDSGPYVGALWGTFKCQSFLLSPLVSNWCLFMRKDSLAFLMNGFLELIFSKGVTLTSLWLCPGDLKCWPTGLFVFLWQSWRIVLRCPTNLFSAVFDVSPK